MFNLLRGILSAMISFPKKNYADKVFEIIKMLLSSKYFPFFTAAVVVACYYLGLDLVTFYYISITSLLILFLLDDITPLFSNFVFMNIMISLKNSPSPGALGSDYYSRTYVLVQIIIIISVLVAAVLYRIIHTSVKRKFKITPAFLGLCGLAVAFMLNGIFSYGYKTMNLLYGAFMAFFFLGIFVLMKDNVKGNKQTTEKVSYAYIALSVALLLILAVKYGTTKGLIVNGSVQRNLLFFGWGTYNQIGTLLTMCIPAVIYVALNHKFGYLFLLYSFLVLAGTYLTFSRQAIISSTIIYFVCLIILLVKGKNRKVNLIITAVAVAICLLFLIIYREHFLRFFKSLLNSLKTGSGRTDIWIIAWENFEEAPLFGTGFYADLPQWLDTVGLDIIPLMYHNTFLQLMASCGMIGLIAYLIHRIQTFISFYKNITVERAIIALIIVGMLLTNLLDNHLFYIFPTIVYSSLIAILIKSEKVAE